MLHKNNNSILPINLYKVDGNKAIRKELKSLENDIINLCDELKNGINEYEEEYDENDENDDVDDLDEDDIKHLQTISLVFDIRNLQNEITELNQYYKKKQHFMIKKNYGRKIIKYIKNDNKVILLKENKKIRDERKNI